MRAAMPWLDEIRQDLPVTLAFAWEDDPYEEDADDEDAGMFADEEDDDFDAEDYDIDDHEKKLEW